MTKEENERKLLSIKEFSKLTGIKSSTLRYFDELGLFQPFERKDNGYRYYAPQQITAINSINLLHDLDVPIKVIANISRSRTPQSILDILKQKTEELEIEAKKIDRRIKTGKTIMKLLTTGIKANENNIEIQYMEDQPIIIGQENNFAGSTLFYSPFIKFCLEAPKYGIDLNLPIGGMFNDMDSFLESPNTPNYFVSVDPDGFQHRPAGNYVVAYTHGYYGDTNSLSARLKKYIEDNNITTVGPVYNIFVLDGVSVKNHDDFLMQFSVKVKD